MDAPSLSAHGLAVLLITLGVFVFFPYAKPDGAFNPQDLFYGFGHPALIAICALMILGHALVVTGALTPLTRRLASAFETHPLLASISIIIVPAGL